MTYGYRKVSLKTSNSLLPRNCFGFLCVFRTDILHLNNYTFKNAIYAYFNNNTFLKSISFVRGKEL